ncbi:MAG: PIG-L family deacetylase [Actinobacteria bacterium]|nr:PIG-L family deacetylase [Actinomycetota bacterium]
MLLLYAAALLLLGIIIVAVRMSLSPLIFPEYRVNKMFEFNKNDRILILAPHPDDEAIGASGVIQEALKAGASLEVAVLTNGDANQEAFLVLEKKPVIFQKQFFKAGELRRQESINGMESLGLSRDNLIYMGYPDFGTLNILLKNWGATRPYRSPITRFAKVPYPECLSPGAPYSGESILSDLIKIIQDFKPTKIFVSSPIDLNKDHRALYLFMKISLWGLGDRINHPEIYSYLVHSYSWPLPRGYYPGLQMVPPKMTSDEIQWYSLDLSNEEIKKKFEAINFYKSQIEYKPTFLISFARKNELFSDFSDIKLNNQANVSLGQIKWQNVEIMQNQNAVSSGGNFEHLEYALMNKNLYIRLTLKRSIDRDLGISIHLLGFSKSRNFAEMPKIHISIGITGLKIEDKDRIIQSSDVNMVPSGKSLIIQVPLSVLGDPDYLLSNAETRARDLPYDATAWRSIIISK